MSKLGKRSLMDNDQLLEGGGAGAGMGFRSGAKEAEAATRRAKKPEKSYFEMTDAEKAALTPAQLRKFGSDVTFKSGGSASSRADGCCSKGKTKGQMR
jgi:hypothetical protein